MKRVKIGPSNGWFCARGLYNLNPIIKLLREMNVEAMEIVLGPLDTEEGNRRIDSLNNTVIVNKFPFLSIHAPDYTEQLPPCRQIIKLTELTATHMPNVVLIHALKVNSGDYPQDYYERLVNAMVPLAIENMDKDKTSGFLIKELEELVLSLGLGFVFDVQHAYEHDHSMQYAQDLFNALNSKITHFHVSGETKSNHHSLLHKASNAEAIISFLGWAYCQIKKSPPMILEGEYGEIDDIEREIKFLQTELSIC